MYLVVKFFIRIFYPVAQCTLYGIYPLGRGFSTYIGRDSLDIWTLRGGGFLDIWGGDSLDI